MWFDKQMRMDNLQIESNLLLATSRLESCNDKIVNKEKCKIIRKNSFSAREMGVGISNA